MTNAEAAQILAAVREGADIDSAAITHALIVSGDIEFYGPKRSAGMDCQIQAQDWRGRIRQRAIMVDESLR